MISFIPSLSLFYNNCLKIAQSIEIKENVDLKLTKVFTKYLIWVKVFKNGTSKICGRTPLKNLE